LEAVSTDQPTVKCNNSGREKSN